MPKHSGNKEALTRLNGNGAQCTLHVYKEEGYGTSVKLVMRKQLRISVITSIK
jgi:hypothetical protein